MIRKLFVMATAVAVVAAFGPVSEAAPKKRVETQRTIELSYQCPCGPQALGSSLGTLIYGFGGVTFVTEDTERYVAVEVDDVLGSEVAGQVSIDTIPGNLEYEQEYNFCGDTDGPVEIAAGGNVDIYLFTGTCTDRSTISMPTTGTVTITLSSRP